MREHANVRIETGILQIEHTGINVANVSGAMFSQERTAGKDI
jgi:hypothetical protein